MSTSLSIRVSLSDVTVVDPSMRGITRVMNSYVIPVCIPKKEAVGVHILHYENASGLLVRRDGFLSYRCPDCKHEGKSRSVLSKCPECKGKGKRGSKG